MVPLEAKLLSCRICWMLQLYLGTISVFEIRFHTSRTQLWFFLDWTVGFAICFNVNLSHRFSTQSIRSNFSPSSLSDGLTFFRTVHLKTFTIDNCLIWKFNDRKMSVKKSCALGPLRFYFHKGALEKSCRGSRVFQLYFFFTNLKFIELASVAQGSMKSYFEEVDAKV